METLREEGVFFQEVLSGGFEICDVCRMEKEQLLEMQGRLGMGNQWGIWEFSSRSMPDGQMQHRSRRFIEMVNIFPGSDAHCVKVNRAWTEIVRYGIVRSLVAGLRSIVKPSTLSTELAILLVLSRKVLSYPFSDTEFWSLLTEEDFKGLKSPGMSLIKTLVNFHLRGLIPDAPLLAARVEGVSAERDRHGEENSERVTESSSKWQPFPDVFTSECGWRSIKIITELGPTLLDALESAMNIPVSKSLPLQPLHPRTQQIKNAQVRDKVIREWYWTAPDGTPLNELGYELELKATRCRGFVRHQKLPVMEWPPKTFSDAWSMLGILQGAHLFPICLASGPRASEVSSLNVNCLQEKEDLSRLLGKTFKFADEFGGRIRDFPAPAIVVAAIKQQIRLSELVKARGEVHGNHLWVHLRNFGRSHMGTKHISLTKFMDVYCTKLKLKKFLSVEAPNVHLHRFRKTLARVVALSLVNSPTILMDCFGHEDPQMTIRSYILSDRQIARDVLVVQRELVILMAVDIIADVAELGGAVGEQLRNRKAEYLQFLGKSEFEPQDAYEFARRETFDGRTWMLVAPGIYCTLPTGEGGPCSKSQSGANPAYCQSGCLFQLLTTYNKVKAEDSIPEIIKNLQRAVDEDEPMLIAQWSGQLNNWLYRWEEIYKKWKNHPLVKLYAPIAEVLHESRKPT
jgi:hypothetical protein